MSIRFMCPACNAELKVSDKAIGKKAPCPKCGQRLLVPPPRQSSNRSHTALGILSAEEVNAKRATAHSVPACDYCGATIPGIAVTRTSLFGYLVCFMLAGLILVTMFLMGVFFPICFAGVVVLPVSLTGLLIRTTRWECPSCGCRR